MKKTMIIEGMSCNHCKMRVENTLGALDGVVSAVVNLEEKSAVVELSAEVSDELLKESVEDAGYDVVSIEA